jgi:hypothetical protein
MRYHPDYSPELEDGPARPRFCRRPTEYGPCGACQDCAPETDAEAETEEAPRLISTRWEIRNALAFFPNDRDAIPAGAAEDEHDVTALWPSLSIEGAIRTLGAAYPPERALTVAVATAEAIMARYVPPDEDEDEDEDEDRPELPMPPAEALAHARATRDWWMAAAARGARPSDAYMASQRHLVAGLASAIAAAVLGADPAEERRRQRADLLAALDVTP